VVVLVLHQQALPLLLPRLVLQRLLPLLILLLLQKRLQPLQRLPKYGPVCSLGTRRQSLIMHIPLSSP
jgi:hypothetical protein